MKKLKFVTAMIVMVLAFSAVGAIAQEVVEMEHRSAEVLKVVGRTVVLRLDTGEIKKYTEMPADVQLYVDGNPAKLEDLREGMKLNAVRLVNVPAPSTITIEEVQQMPASSAPMAEAAPAAPAAAPAPAQLPKTGSHLPLAGQAGLALLLLGAGIAVLRRA